MNIQNQIKRALSKPEAIEYVRQLLEEEEDELFTRTELAEVVCEALGFQDPRGQNQLRGCLKGLRELEAKGWFQLPGPEIQKGGPSPRRLSQTVAEPEAVPADVGDVGGLELILVEQESHMRIWKSCSPISNCRFSAPTQKKTAWRRLQRCVTKCASSPASAATWVATTIPDPVTN